VLVRWMVYLWGLSGLVAVAALLVERARSAAGETLREAWIGGVLLIPGVALLAAWIAPWIPGIRMPGLGGGWGWRSSTSPEGIQLSGEAALSAGPEGSEGMIPGFLRELTGTLLDGLGPLPGLLREWSAHMAPFLLLAWAGVSLLLALRWWRTDRRLRREVARWPRQELLGQEVRLTDGLGPGLVGTFRTELILPRWALSLSREELDLVLAHEEEHRRRRDPAVLGVARLLMILVPWNLPLWWMGRRMGEAMELDCDRSVVGRHPHAVRRYAELLLATASRPRPSTPGPSFAAPLASLADQSAPLHRRLLMITKRPEPRPSLRILWLGTGALAVILLALFLPTPDGEAGAATPEGTVLTQRPGGMEDAGPAASPTGEVADLPVGRDGPDPGVGADTIRNIPPTPFTVPPEVRNRQEVSRALVDEYPPLLRNAGVGGTVLLYFFIDTEGVVQEVRLHQSSGHRALDEAALRVGSVFRFSAAMNRDERVPVWIQIPLTFTTQR
jgi:TonB family protein